MLWAFIGTIYLCILTWQDYKRNMRVDDRKNYFMIGFTVALIGFITRPVWYLLVIFGMILLIRWLYTKYNVMGGGDINSIMWIYYGFAVLGWNYLFLFLVVFLFMNVVYYVIKLGIIRYRGVMPYYPILLLSFVLTCLLKGIY